MIKDGKFVCSDFPQYEIKWGMFNDKENKDFKIRDDIKTKFCKDNDIKLIRVAWGHNHIHTYENIENYLDDKFDKILSVI